MNRASVVRCDPGESGVMLRLWIDDETGRHVAVCELALGEKTMRTYLIAVREEQQDAAQYQLDL